MAQQYYSIYIKLLLLVFVLVVLVVDEVEVVECVRIICDDVFLTTGIFQAKIYRE
jgi:hypothetical protein